MTALVLHTGAGTGIGLCLILLGLFPRPVPLVKALDALTRRPHNDPAVTDPRAVGFTARWGRPGVRLLRRAGLPVSATRRDLATLGKPVAVHLAEQVTATVAGLVLPITAALLLALAGVNPGLTVPVGVALAGAAAGFLAPELAVRAEALRRRASARHALSSYLNLVVVSLAGGSGVDQALDDAATVGRGATYTDLRDALAEARLARVPPWDTLTALGKRLNVEQLQQLAASVGLAGTEGAAVRASLTSRAQALRTRQLADVDAEASAATERMSLPVVCLFAGFLIFLGMPAVVAVLTGL
jgi:tight adherence protein C